MKSRSALLLLLLSQVVLVLFLLQQFLPEDNATRKETPIVVESETKEETLPDDWVGRRLPDVPLETPNGPTSLRQIRGPAVVEFISTSCPYCKKMAPIFDRVMRTLPADFLVVGVGSESLASMRRWHTQEIGQRMPGSYALDRLGRATSDLGLVGTPTTVFIDRTGRVQFFLAGEFSEEELRGLVSKTLTN